MLSIDTRERLIRAYEASWDAERVAQSYGVDRSTVYRLERLKQETGSVKPRTNLCGRKAALSPGMLEQINGYIREQPDITIHELNAKLGNPASDETVRKAVVTLGWRYKKKALYASERRRVRCCGKTGNVAGRDAKGGHKQAGVSG